MAIERKSTVIGDHTFELAPLAGRKAYSMFNRLTKRFGGGLAAALTGDAKGLVELFGAIDPKELDEVLQVFIADGACTVDGKPCWPMFDTLFAAKVDQIFQLLWFALTVNYGSFSAGPLAQFVERAKGSLSGKLSTSPTPGPSGESGSPDTQP